MKKDIHPEYREVVFQDVSAGEMFITRSTVKTRDTTTVDGKEYPLYSVSISSFSHPYFTGKEKFVDTAGRIEKFQRRYQVEGDTSKILQTAPKKSKKQLEREARAAAAQAQAQAHSLKKAQQKADEKAGKEARSQGKGESDEATKKTEE